MFKYPFQFKGGSFKVEQKQYKFHLYTTDNNGKEDHLYQAEKVGIVERSQNDFYHYTCAYPVVKVFTSTKGFGVRSEYFSYFFLINPEANKQVTILPLGFEDPGLSIKNCVFVSRGRFLTDAEIARLYGKNSNTYKYFKRQSMISKQRLLSMVKIEEVDGMGEVTQTPQVRKLRAM